MIIVSIKRRLLPLFALLLVAPLVLANPGGGRFGQHEQSRQNDQQRQSPQREFQRDSPREEPQRFQRRDEGNSGEQQRQRLSPEERRQLRRDIHDAGRDIYPPRR